MENQPTPAAEYHSTPALHLDASQREAFVQRMWKHWLFKNIPPQELAETLDLDHKTFQSLAAGQLSVVEEKVLTDLADTLSVTVDYLLGATDDLPYTVEELAVVVWESPEPHCGFFNRGNGRSVALDELNENELLVLLPAVEACVKETARLCSILASRFKDELSEDSSFAFDKDNQQVPKAEAERAATEYKATCTVICDRAKKDRQTILRKLKSPTLRKGDAKEQVSKMAALHVATRMQCRKLMKEAMTALYTKTHLNPALIEETATWKSDTQYYYDLRTRTLLE